MKKFLFLLAIVGIIVAIIYFFGGGFGLFGGSGTGDSALSVSQEAPTQEEEPVQEVEPEEVQTPDQEPEEPQCITIEVNQDAYFMDGEATTLTKIESILAEDSDMALTYLLEDNYGSAKAWDALKALFLSYGVSYTQN